MKWVKKNGNKFNKKLKILLYGALKVVKDM